MAPAPPRTNRLQKASGTPAKGLENYTTTRTESTNRHKFRNASDPVYQKLLDDLPAQLQLNETELGETRANFHRSRRRGFPLLNVGSLPDEVLVKILRFVLNTRPTRRESYRDEYRDTRKDGPLVEPNLDYIAITHVCSVWRKVAMGSNDLWTDIEISPFSPFLPQFLARAKIYASLSNGLPLDLRILDDCDATLSTRAKIRSGLIKLIKSIAPRLRSLELGIYWDSTPVHEIILNECLRRCKSGTLTRLDIMTNRLSPSSRSYYPIGMLPRHSFFQSEPQFPFEEPDDSVLAFTEISYRRFEKLLGRITTLRLNHLYPMWSSSAYHGLVELHLGSRNEGEGPSPIPESSLAAILRSSPGLRILHFGLKVVPEKPCPPIHLNDLESLVLETPCADSQRSLLRTISPGKKLFRVNIKLRVSNNETKRKSGLLPAILSQLRRCVAHSKVAEFFLDTNLRHHQVTLRDILKIIPHVGVLGLEEASFDTDGIDLCKSLHTLHLRFCYIIFDSFKEFVCAHRLKRVTVSQPIISNGEFDESGKIIELPARYLLNIRRTMKVISLYDNTDRRILVDGWDY